MGLDQKEFALVYDPPLIGLHSVYVKSYDQQVQKVTCINSWGNQNQNPELDLKDVKFLYSVNCSTVDATQQSNICHLCNFLKN